MFLRSQNSIKTREDRVGDRENILKSTLVVLNERFEGKEVYLVGTMNNSTMLA